MLTGFNLDHTLCARSRLYMLSAAKGEREYKASGLELSDKAMT